MQLCGRMEKGDKLIHPSSRTWAALEDRRRGGMCYRWIVWTT